MTVQTVLVCEAQVPFVHGGAEVHVRQLVRELRQRGYTAELVSVPFKWYPKEEILPHAAAWRLLDLSESNGRPVDLVIGTKFPSYFARHPNKVAWLIHQYRAAYELCGTEYSDFSHTELDVGLRDTLMRLDTEMLGECRALFANARNTASRLAKFNGLRAEALYHPPNLAPRLVPGPYGDYVLSVGRIESVKRVDLIIKAMASVDRQTRLVIAGDGTQRQYDLAKEIAPGGRLDQMLSRMDIISVNCPHTPATFHLLSARRLKLLQKHAYLVNTSRGEVVDENALTRMLDQTFTGVSSLKDANPALVTVSRGYREPTCFNTEFNISRKP